MSPTPKQVRYHYGKIMSLHRKLAHALNRAHAAKVLVYTSYQEESPCSTHYQTDDRIDKTCEKALANAMRQEIRRSQE